MGDIPGCGRNPGRMYRMLERLTVPKLRLSSLHLQSPGTELSPVSLRGNLAFAFKTGGNLTGVWACLKHELLTVSAAGPGSMVNTASVAGVFGTEDPSLAYGANFPARRADTRARVCQARVVTAGRTHRGTEAKNSRGCLKRG